MNNFKDQKKINYLNSKNGLLNNKNMIMLNLVFNKQNKL